MANLIHRDVKPANVLLADHARGTADSVYLVDFGIARDTTANTSLTVAGAAVGTPDYMAPERFAAGRVDHRADIYALGCLLYEMLTGSKPFAGGEYPALLFKHLNAEPPKPSAVRPGVPVALDEVVVRSMAKNPEARFRTAGELAAAAEQAVTAPQPRRLDEDVMGVKPFAATAPMPSGSRPNAYTPAPSSSGYTRSPPGYPAQHSQGTNGFAIASLIFGIIGGAILGFIFGFIALSQTKRTGQSGRGMAVAGIALSAMWTVGLVLLIVVAVAASSTGDDNGGLPTTTPTTTADAPSTPAPSTAISATDLEVGECLNDLAESTDVSSLPSVPCAQPHQGEVFAVFDLPAGPFPGSAGVDDLVNQGCNARLADYSPGAPADPAISLFSVYPLEKNWDQGDREVVCIAKATAGTATGSIKAN